MKKQNHSHKLLLLLAICVTLFVGALYGYMYYMVGASASRAVKARDVVRTEDLNKSQEQEIALVYKGTSADRARLNDFFIPKDKVVTFIEALESLGNAAGSSVTISSIDSENLDAAAPGATGNIHASISVVGSWPAVMRTLEMAELLPYKSAIRNVQLDGEIVPEAKEAKSVKREWRMAFDLTAVLVVPPKSK